MLKIIITVLYVALAIALAVYAIALARLRRQVRELDRLVRDKKFMARIAGRD